MSKVFEFTKKKNLENLPIQQKAFVAKMMVKEIQNYALTHDVSEETVFELYSKGMLGSDRSLG